MSNGLSGLLRVRVLIFENTIYVGLTGTGPFSSLSHAFSRERHNLLVSGEAEESHPVIEDYQFFTTVSIESAETAESSGDSSDSDSSDKEN